MEKVPSEKRISWDYPIRTWNKNHRERLTSSRRRCGSNKFAWKSASLSIYAPCCYKPLLLREGRISFDSRIKYGPIGREENLWRCIGRSRGWCRDVKTERTTSVGDLDETQTRILFEAPARKSASSIAKCERTAWGFILYAIDPSPIENTYLSCLLGDSDGDREFSSSGYWFPNQSELGRVVWINWEYRNSIRARLRSISTKFRRRKVLSDESISLTLTVNKRFPATIMEFSEKKGSPPSWIPWDPE